MFIIKSKWNYVESKGHVFTMPSETVPDQTMSMRTILEKYAKGQPLSGSVKTPVWNGVDPIPDLRKLDFVERQELMEQLMQEYKSIKAQKETDDQKRKTEQAKREERELATDLNRGQAEDKREVGPIQP